MLTPEQLEVLADKITEKIEEFLDPVTIAENRYERCDYGCRMHTVITPVARQLTAKIIPLIEQEIEAERTARDEAIELLRASHADDRVKVRQFAAIIGRLTSNANASITEEAFIEWLASGEMPEGWERRTEVRLPSPRPYGHFQKGHWRNLDGSIIDTRHWPRRIAITGPWEATDE